MPVPDEDVRVLFDIATNSLDFGSGFLDDEEVETLRRVAVMLGVDPKLATPYAFEHKYEPTPKDKAVKAGHIGVASERVRIGENTPYELYTCACGWKGHQADYDAHLTEVGKTL